MEQESIIVHFGNFDKLHMTRLKDDDMLLLPREVVLGLLKHPRATVLDITTKTYVCPLCFLDRPAWWLATFTATYSVGNCGVRFGHPQHENYMLKIDGEPFWVEIIKGNPAGATGEGERCKS